MHFIEGGLLSHKTTIHTVELPMNSNCFINNAVTYERFKEHIHTMAGLHNQLQQHWFHLTTLAWMSETWDSAFSTQPPHRVGSHILNSIFVPWWNLECHNNSITSLQFTSGTTSSSNECSSSNLSMLNLQNLPSLTYVGWLTSSAIWIWGHAHFSLV